VNKARTGDEKRIGFANEKLCVWGADRSTQPISCFRSGTAIGALVREAEYGISKADFRNKMSIALKEANETEYWLSILGDSDYLDEKLFRSLSGDCVELIKILIATVKTTQPK
jgi:four helix bundle protein